ncbi:porin, partial [Bradyrhizobium sp. INPA03-11B]|uniref:porin n=1 Tax=Bradyrhizobium sp. INPA03-11B TaxID=418598 RepID=UPI00338EF138
IGGVQAPNNANSGAVAGGVVGVYAAFIQFAGFTIGRAVSQFSAPWINYPANNFDALVGGGSAVTGVNQFTYTADFGPGVSVSISAQDQALYNTTNIWNTTNSTATGVIAGAYGSSSFGGMVAPDIVGMIRIDQAWGLFQASLAAHDNHTAYYGATEATGHAPDRWGWAGQLALSINHIPTGPGDSINVQAVYTNGASRYNIQENIPSAWAMYGGAGLAGVYQSVGIAGVSDAIYSGATAASGTGLELTTTYGFRGGYNHNWDPYWSTGIYGALAAVRYTGGAKALICSSPGMTALAPAGTCNPDFDIAQVGMITRWTPVKNLSFSAEVAYTRLDQKYSGTITAPAAASVAKPAAVYEMKDQNTVAMLLRAQRNW